MPSQVQPRRIIINGHPTSVRLEPAYWGWLREIAAECGLTAKAFIEGVVAAKDPKCPLASALRLYIAHYFRSSAPRYEFPDPDSRFAIRIERPRRSRKDSKKTAVEIKPPVQDGINNPVVVRQDSNLQVLSGKFLGDLGFTFARSERRPAPTFCFPLINHFLCIGIEDGLDFSKRSDDVASAAIRRTTIVQ